MVRGVGKSLASAIENWGDFCAGPFQESPGMRVWWWGGGWRTASGGPSTGGCSGVDGPQLAYQITFSFAFEVRTTPEAMEKRGAFGAGATEGAPPPVSRHRPPDEWCRWQRSGFVFVLLCCLHVEWHDRRCAVPSSHVGVGQDQRVVGPWGRGLHFRDNLHRAPGMCGPFVSVGFVHQQRGPPKTQYSRGGRSGYC